MRETRHRCETLLLAEYEAEVRRLTPMGMTVMAATCSYRERTCVWKLSHASGGISRQEPVPSWSNST